MAGVLEGVASWVDGAASEAAPVVPEVSKAREARVAA